MIISLLRFGPFATAVALLAPVTAAAIFLVWTRVSTVCLGYELARLQTVVQTLEERNHILSTEVSALRSPDRLRAMATERFGLRPPSRQQVAVFSSEKRGDP